MIRPLPKSTRTDTLLPVTTLVRSHLHVLADLGDQLGAQLFDSFAADAGRLQGLDIGCAERGVGDGLGGGDEVGVLGDEVGLGVDLDQHGLRSEEHTSELQSLMRISYAVFCLKKKTT